MASDQTSEELQNRIRHGENQVGRCHPDAATDDTEGFLRKILDSSLAGVYLYDLKVGVNVFINQQYTELTGYTLDRINSMSGRDFATLFHPEDGARVADHMKTIAQTADGETVEIEYRFRTAGGRWMWCLSRDMVFTRDPDGSVRQFLGTFLDVTARKEAEERERLEHRETTFANRVLRAFVECEGDQLFAQVLAVVQEEMSSRHGVFGYISQPGHLFCPSLSKMLDACKVEGKCIHYPPEKWKGLWAKALKEKCSLYNNKASPVPPGHPAIRNNLAAPILFQGKAIGLLNLANKAGGYTEADRSTLEHIAERIAPVLYAWIQRKLREDERKQVEDALTKAHDELENRVQERTSELAEAVQRLQDEIVQRKRLEETLRESEKRVRLFASQCLTAQESERRRIAAELHDSLAASLAATKFRIETISQEMKQGRGGPESMKDLGSNIGGIIKDVRRIMADLRPSILDDLGILAAVNWLCREYQETYSHITVEKQIGIEERDVPDSIKTPIFRISQEVMNNVAKHSRASLVNLSLQREGERILLTIRDNGQGFDPEKVKKGMGLSSIRERAELSGGVCELHSTMGKGITVRVWWPIQVGNVA